MGIVLSLRTVADLARAAVPIFVDSLAGRVSRESVDRRVHALAQQVVTGAHIRLDVRGRDLVPRDRAFVFMSNHQSHIDIPVLYATVPVDTLRMVAKAELFRIPVWGRAMRAGDFVEVDRSNHQRAIDSMHRAGEQLARGVSLWIAPEGTRSENGEIGALKKGGFHLAMETGTPIVPIAIDGTRHILPKGGRSMTPGVTVRVTFGAPIEVAGRTMQQLMDEVRSFFLANVGAPL